MKKTKRFAAMIAALTMTACAGTMNLSAKAAYGNSGYHGDIFLDVPDNNTSADSPYETSIVSEGGSTSAYMGGKQSIYNDAGVIRDGVIDLKVNVDGESPYSEQEIKEIVAEDIWCIDVESDGCTWHVTNTGPKRYYFVKWDPVTQLYGVYIYNTENASGNAQVTVDSLRVDGEFGFDNTVHNVKFTNKSNFQVKLTATVLSDGEPVLGWDNSRTWIEGSNDQFMCGFATKTSPSPSFEYQDDVILNHPVTSAGVTSGADESKNYLDADQTQRAILKVKLKENSEFYADKTGRIVVNFTKPTTTDGVMTDDLYAPLNTLNYLTGEVDNYTISGSATAEQLANRAGAVSTYSEANPRVWTNETVEDSLAEIADGAEDWWE